MTRLGLLVLWLGGCGMRPFESETTSKTDGGGLTYLGDSDADTDADSDADADADADCPDDGIYYSGYYGEAEVQPTRRLDGFEWAYFIGFDGAASCIVASDTRAVSPRTDCAACEWAFDVSIEGSHYATDADLAGTDLEGALHCDWLGVDDPSLYDGTFGYGYQPDYYISGYGDYEVLQYYFEGYGWYAVALASFDGSTFAYDWPANYYYYYACD